jgi:hypothetical protein
MKQKIRPEVWQQMTPEQQKEVRQQRLQVRLANKQLEKEARRLRQQKLLIHQQAKREAKERRRQKFEREERLVRVYRKYSRKERILEKGVTVMTHQPIIGQRNKYYIDPQEMFASSLGIWLSRWGCMVSFMDGVSAAGFWVEVMNLKDGQWLAKKYERYNNINYAYFFLGLAWALNRWDEVVAQLKNVRHECLMEVIVETAKMYFSPTTDRRIFQLWIQFRQLKPEVLARLTKAV